MGSSHNSKPCLLYKVCIYIYVHRHKDIKSSEKGSYVPKQGAGVALSAGRKPTVRGTSEVVESSNLPTIFPSWTKGRTQEEGQLIIQKKMENIGKGTPSFTKLLNAPNSKLQSPQPSGPKLRSKTGFTMHIHIQAIFQGPCSIKAAPSRFSPQTAKSSQTRGFKGFSLTKLQGKGIGGKKKSFPSVNALRPSQQRRN